MQKIESLMSALPTGASVAVVSMLGSLCPVTLGHVRCFEEARRILLDDPLALARRPIRLGHFSECLGFICLNGDGYVSRKVQQKGQLPLNYRERAHLVHHATAEQPWLNFCELYVNDVMADLRRRWPRLQFVAFDMNGADDVLKNRKWRYAGPQNRMITMGRPGSTEIVLRDMKDYGIDPGDGYYFMGPELPDISSTAVRSASAKGDLDTLLTMLHPTVADWMLRKDGHQGPPRAQPVVRDSHSESVASGMLYCLIPPKRAAEANVSSSRCCRRRSVTDAVATGASEHSATQ